MNFIQHCINKAVISDNIDISDSAVRIRKFKLISEYYVGFRLLEWYRSSKCLDSVTTMPAFCTSGLRSFVDSPTLLTGYDPVMRCGVDRQLPVGRVVYPANMHALNLRQCHQHQQVRAETTKCQSSTGVIKNENGNEKERNLTSALLCAGSMNAKTQKYSVPTSYNYDYFHIILSNAHL